MPVQEGLEERCLELPRSDTFGASSPRDDQVGRVRELPDVSAAPVTDRFAPAKATELP